jgi:hypothetical protein
VLRSGSKPPPFLNSALGRGERQFHIPAALPRGNSPYCPLDTRLGGSQSRFWRCRIEKRLLCLPGIEPGPSLYLLSYQCLCKKSLIYLLPCKKQAHYKRFYHFFRNANTHVNQTMVCMCNRSNESATEIVAVWSNSRWLQRAYVISCRSVGLCLLRTSKLSSRHVQCIT